MILSSSLACSLSVGNVPFHTQSPLNLVRGWFARTAVCSVVNKCVVTKSSQNTTKTVNPNILNGLHITHFLYNTPLSSYSTYFVNCVESFFSLFNIVNFGGKFREHEFYLFEWQIDDTNRKNVAISIRKILCSFGLNKSFSIFNPRHHHQKNICHPYFRGKMLMKRKWGNNTIICISFYQCLFRQLVLCQFQIF